MPLFVLFWYFAWNINNFLHVISLMTPPLCIPFRIQSSGILTVYIPPPGQNTPAGPPGVPHMTTHRLIT